MADQPPTPEKGTLRCRLFGHKFHADRGLLDPSPEEFHFCLRCYKPRPLPPGVNQ